MSELALQRDQFLELQKLGIGAFAPLTGFMGEADFVGVVERMRLADGRMFPLPVYLDVTASDASRLAGHHVVDLVYEGTRVGTIEPTGVFGWDRLHTARQVFGVDSPDHPGVARMLGAGERLIGGSVALTDAGQRFLFADELSPRRTRELFAERGWKTVAGFQTRNVPHRAHEYLQRVALEICDGLFVQPLVGHKKAGDYTPEAILAAYKAMIAEFLPTRRVVLGVLSTAMRYAGPREALFHALIRRNYGCTHFIVGRDHAGVGGYYGTYEAQDLAKRFAPELGIEILALHGPFYCRRCDGIATDQTCPHVVTDPEATTEISGTIMRRLLRDASPPRPELMRPEVIAALAGIEMFVEGDES